MIGKTKILTLLVGVALVLAGLGASTAVAKPAATKLSIRSWPQGLFGYVQSATPGCAQGRKVTVYEQRGERRAPGSDRRVASARADDGDHPQWAAKVGGTGSFYAVAVKAPGCASAQSKLIRLLPRAAELNSTSADYPTCSPYLSETQVGICKLDQIYAQLDSESFGKSCSFSRSSGSCPGTAQRGPFPWGVTGDGQQPSVRLYWNWGNHEVQLVTLRFGPTGVAHLGGTMPGPGSNRFSVTDAFAQNEKGYPNGDHFFTPDLPGQGAGEVGGPLNVNFVAGGWSDYGADLYIDGYLYLKR